MVGHNFFYLSRLCSHIEKIFYQPGHDSQTEHFCDVSFDSST